jgi:hypothetical protein
MSIKSINEPEGPGRTTMLLPNSINEPLTLPEGGSDQAPVINALTPDGAEVGGPDIVMVIDGTGFTLGSVIVWNGGDEPTTVLDGERVSTTVKPSTASGPWAIPVAVRNGDRMSNQLTFTFSETGATRSSPKRRSK